MEEVIDAVNAELVELLKNRSRLHYEHPVDVDRHGNNLTSVEEDIKTLREIREKLEDRLSQ